MPGTPSNPATIAFKAFISMFSPNIDPITLKINRSTKPIAPFHNSFMITGKDTLKIFNTMYKNSMAIIPNIIDISPLFDYL